MSVGISPNRPKTEAIRWVGSILPALRVVPLLFFDMGSDENKGKLLAGESSSIREPALSLVEPSY